MAVLDLFDGDVTFLLERSVQAVVECNNNVILKSQFVLGEIFWHHSANSLVYIKLVPLFLSLHIFAFRFIPHTHKPNRPCFGLPPNKAQACGVREPAFLAVIGVS